MEKINAAIEADSSNADYEQLGSLYEEKYRLEERIESLYAEWVEENENGDWSDASRPARPCSRGDSDA